MVNASGLLVGISKSRKKSDETDSRVSVNPVHHGSNIASYQH